MSTPACPACGAKFSHSEELCACKKCGLPDEVRVNGTRAIARWKRRPTGIVLTESGIAVPGQRLDSLSKRERKHRSRNSRTAKPRNKHGRKGVKRV